MPRVATRSPLGAILRNELRLLKRDSPVMILLIAMPLVVISILKSTMGVSLIAGGAESVNGAEQAVPGMTLLFSFFIVGFIGLSFFREHGWGTWDRLRSSRASRADVLIGKTLPWAAVSLIQLATLLTLGVYLFDLEIGGGAALIGLAIVAVAWTAFLMAFALAVVSIARSVQLVQAIANLGSMVFAALGGALVPYDQLPGWAQTVAPVVPTHWAMRGFSAVLIDGEGINGTIIPALVLLGFSAFFALLASTCFDFNEAKTSFA